MDKRYLPYIILILLSLIVVSLASCTKPTDGNPPVTVKKNSPPVTTASVVDNDTWSHGPFKHTAGLRRMAITGDVHLLNEEFGEQGVFGNKIPTGLGDDIYDAGYASQLTIGNYIVAMYHPNEMAPDHFITYNIVDKSWVHWKLGNSPIIIIQSQ